MNKIMYVFDYIQFHLVPALWFTIIAIALYGGAGFLAESFRLTYNAIKDTITLHDKIAFGSGFCVMFLCIVVATIAMCNAMQYLTRRKGR